MLFLYFHSTQLRVYDVGKDRRDRFKALPKTPAHVSPVQADAEWTNHYTYIETEHRGSHTR